MLFRRHGHQRAPHLPLDWREWHRVPQDRLELAEEIESCSDFGIEPEGRGRHRISLYDDLRGLVGDEAIEPLSEKISALDGVKSCTQVDREEMEVEGAITAEQLAAFIIAELAATGNATSWDDR